jgi:hypothetical protein
MTEKYENNETFQKIKELIRKEEEKALHIFDQKDFAFQVAQKIKSQHQQKPQKKPFLSIIFPKPAYAAAMAMLLLLVGIVAVYFMLAPSSLERNVRELEGFFFEVSAFTSHQPQEDVTAEILTPRSQLERTIKGVLYKIHPREYSRQELTVLFTRVLCPECELPQKEEPATISEPEGLEVEPGKLNLEKRIKHLMKEKMIDRFLYKLKKQKEV